MSNTALVTGASSGIGLELARILASNGCNLVLTARSKARLDELKTELVNDHSVHVEVIAADLSEVNAAEMLFGEITRRKLVVDILVNNAGFGELGRFHEIDLDRQLNMIQLNVVALTHLTRLLLPEMLKRKKGGILNVASTAAFQPGPNMAVYYATKAYVLSFSEALHEELTGTGVSVSCLAPGPTLTGFGSDSGMNKSRLFAMGTMDAATVAKAGYNALRRNRALVVPGFKNRAGAFLTRLSPRWFTMKIVKWLQPLESRDSG